MSLHSDTKKIQDQKRGYRTEIDKDIPGVVELLKKYRVKKVLDLGCGLKRHTVYLAEQGFEVYGIDIAEKGVKKADQKLRDLKTCAALTTGSIFHVLPYETNFLMEYQC